MSGTGLVTVRADFRDCGVHDIRVALSRPSVTRLFIDQLPDVVVKTVPYLFTLCAQAQRAVAQAAVLVAQGETMRSIDHRELWVEVLHENFWRLLLDWPPALGLHADKEAFVAWRNARQGDGCLQATQDLLHRAVRPMFEKCREMLVDRSTEEVAPDEAPGKTPAPTDFTPDAWLDFWQGRAAQMPAIVRPASIYAAFLARMKETESAVQSLLDGSPYPLVAAGGGGWGVAQTLTARGVLTHAVHIEDGVVANYFVQAPTDGFFANTGALETLLADCRIASLEQARQLINQAILALDPCVPYVVELKDA